MKIHSFISHLIIFLSILFGCILPPFFASSSSQKFVEWNFPFVQGVFFIIALLLYIYYSDFENEKIGFKKFIIIKFFPGIFALGILFGTALLIKAFSILIFKNQISSTEVVLPDSLIKWIFCILNFLFAAFYEEVIYRFYLPESLFFFFSKISSKKIFSILIEFVVTLIFAFSHLYLGWISVLNAGIAHVVLRICLKKTKTIYSGFAAHFIYNILSLLFIA